ncbi:glycosyl hydrolase family 8 [Pseudochrobactrum sp. MP213Fo]|uniref:glycosyl hydrolase family 8 n=1 Tax=Pseudochrobactrum sp. MP213Fo TaxID=3022250 RepID=UPI003BA269CD
MKNRKNRWLTAIVAGAAWLLPLQSALSDAATAPDKAIAMISLQDWTAYSEKFLTREGRIIDDANGHISHSEGQGYGLLLAYMADRQADFELIWSFTQTEMLIRNDGLSVWKWDPAVRPHITDTNNASDGDILIAYALALAARKWNNEEYRKTATTIAGTLLKKQITEQNGETLLLPAIRGFSRDEREDGPVINLSYLVFEAFPVFNELVPSPLWAALTQSGLNLLEKSRFGTAQLPSDWISLRNAPHPAHGFEPEFGYNNLRIALYLSRAGFGKQAMTQHIAKAMTAENGNINLVNVTLNTTIISLNEPGYRIIPQLAACINSGTKLYEDVRRFTPTHYYPSTLHLLALSYIGQNHKECL